jgi:hypothetical protein
LVQLYSFFKLGTRWGWVVNATPRPLYPGKESRYPLYRMLVGPQSRSEVVRKVGRWDSSVYIVALLEIYTHKKEKE